MKDVRDVKIGECLRYDYEEGGKKYSKYIVVRYMIRNNGDIHSPHFVLRGDTFTCNYSTGDDWVHKKDDSVIIPYNNIGKTVIVDMYEPFKRYMNDSEVRAVNLFYRKHIDILLNSKDKWLEFETDYGQIIILVNGVIDRGCELMFNCHIKVENPEVNIPKQEVKVELDTSFHLSKLNFEYLNYKVLSEKEARDRINDFIVKLIEKKL